MTRPPIAAPALVPVEKPLGLDGGKVSSFGPDTVVFCDSWGPVVREEEDD